MKNFFLTRLQNAINRYLQLDPDSSKRLSTLQDRTITLELMPLSLIFQLTFTSTGVLIAHGDEKNADTTIRGTPLQLFSMLASQDNRQQFFADDLSMTGDAELGQQVMQLFEAVEIDWEEQLSKLTGDVASHQLGRMARGMQSWFKATQSSLGDDLRDYLQEEKLWLPPKLELTRFYHEIDELSMRVDRIAAKITTIRATLNNINEEDL